MSTQFVIHALDEGDLEGARRQMAGSLGYGNTDFATISAAAMANQTALMADPAAALAVYDTPSLVVMNDHQTLHDEDEPCLAHALVDVIGHELPILDGALTRRIREVMDDFGSVDAKSLYVDGWLAGARGRRLWYVFA